MALCPLSIRELALRPRMPKLLRRAPVFLRMSLLRLMIGVSLKGKAIFLVSDVLECELCLVCTPPSTSIGVDVDCAGVAAAGGGVGGSGGGFSRAFVVFLVTPFLLGLGLGCSSSTGFSGVGDRGGRPRVLRCDRVVFGAASTGAATGSSKWTACWLDLRVDTLLGGGAGCGDSSTTGATDATEAFVFLGRPAFFGAGAGIDAISSSGIGSGCAVFTFFVPRVKRKSPSCSSYAAKEKNGQVSINLPSNISPHECPESIPPLILLPPLGQQRGMKIKTRHTVEARAAASLARLIAHAKYL